MLNWLMGEDVRTVIENSSGNAGTSLACYIVLPALELLLAFVGST